MDTAKRSTDDTITYEPHQRAVLEYMLCRCRNRRGLIVYHGMGSGKSAIGAGMVRNMVVLPPPQRRREGGDRRLPQGQSQPQGQSHPPRHASSKARATQTKATLTKATLRHNDDDDDSRCDQWVLLAPKALHAQWQGDYVRRFALREASAYLDHDEAWDVLAPAHDNNSAAARPRIDFARTLLVVDEAHNLSRTMARLSPARRALAYEALWRFRRRILLTGTPVY